ncbi:MAG: hypothetical protein WAL31_06205 [Gaiellaceae bacterium]
MALFRRRRQETLNEQLLREAGLDPEQVLGDSPPPPPPQPLEPPRSGLARAGVVDGSGIGPKEWDAAVTVAAPALMGDRVQFTTIPNGDVIVGEEHGDADLTPLADAVERRLSPPYRAVGQRQDGDLWGLGAKRIQVAQFAFPDGDRLELSQHVDHGELLVDGEPNDSPVPAELQRLGEALGDSFYVQADRIDGDYWEVRASAL